MIVNHQEGNVFVIVLGVLLLILASAAGYVWWQNAQLKSESTVELKPIPIVTSSSSPTPTQAEKTYRNEKLGFELKIPSDWKVDDSQGLRDSSGDDVIFRFGCPECHEGISVDPANGQTVNDLVREFNKEIIISIQEITIDREKGKIIHTGEPVDFAFVKHNNNIYTFTGGRLFSDGVISTFKFL